MTVTVDQPVETGGGPASPRGRVVMLVDNAVEGDSRVQKAARSAAAAGWDVTLVGAGTPATKRTTWRLGDAKVQVVKVARPLGTHRSRLCWSPRRPLAYSNAQFAANRQQAARAARTDLRMRRLDGGRLRLLPARVRVKLFELWVRLRVSQTHRLAAARADDRALLNRIPVAFWSVVRRHRCWRTLDPSLWDFEVGVGPVVDRLKPDIIHAHDYRILGVAARAKQRARARGRDVKLVWDAHEYVPGLPPTPGWPGWLPAQVGYEAEYRVHADAVVTISETCAELLQKRHRLTETPAVVANCPELGAAGESPRDLRADCGVGPDTPLIVYCGGISKLRGCALIVQALADLPGVHAAFVSLHPSGRRGGIEDFLQVARAHGVEDRVHLLPYVEHWQVVSYLAGADLAVNPLLHLPNHEIALSNKFFEYSQARLPIVTSDVRTMAETVRRTGQGEVYVAGDKPDYLRAVRAVLADPAKYRAAYDAPGLLEGWTWPAQAAVLDQVYRRLLPVAAVPAQSAGPGLRQPTPGR